MIGITRPDNTQIRIEFLHTQAYSIVDGRKIPIPADYGKETPTKLRTEARLFVLTVGARRETAVQIAHGNSFCSVLERLDEGVSMKEEGRRRALHRAIEDAERDGLIDHTERGMLLASYYNRPRGRAGTPARPQPTTTQENT